MEVKGFCQSRDLETLNTAPTQAGRKPLSASGLETKGRHKWLLIRIYHLNASFRALSAVFLYLSAAEKCTGRYAWGGV